MATEIKIYVSQADVPDDDLCIEFAIGPDYQTTDHELSLYMSGEIFWLLADVFHDTLTHFNPPLGPTTISGQRLKDLAEALRAYGKRLGEAEDPADIWDSERLVGSIFEAREEWPAHRQSLGLVLRDLRRWLRAASDRGDPVTVF